MFDGQGRWILFGYELPINERAFWYSAIILLIVTITTVLVVKLNEASRNLTVNYAKRVRGNRLYGGVTTTLPIKLITAGVIPIIFAVAFLSAPSFVGQILQGTDNLRLQEIGAQLVQWFQTPTAQTFAAGGWQPYIYPAVYFLLVFVFTFFYTNIQFDSHEISENLQKQGGFLEGVRSGKQTEKYLTTIVNRLTLFGAISLGLLAVTPIIAQAFLEINITVGGTSILILVAVALETLRKIESQALMLTYDAYEQPDFLYEATDAAEAGTGGRRLRLRKRSKKEK